MVCILHCSLHFSQHVNMKIDNLSRQKRWWWWWWRKWRLQDRKEGKQNHAIKQNVMPRIKRQTCWTV